jgi:DNA-binding phage protein
VLAGLQTTKVNDAMPLTKDFKETVRARLIKSAGFRKAVLQEAVDGLLAGDLETGKALLRDYVNGTMGFERLGELTQIPVKSLMRMLGPKGNPQAKNLFDVIAHLQRAEGVRFAVSLKSRTRVRAA